MASTIRFEDQLEIPLDIRSLESFRLWASSSEFPDRGRIDFFAGAIEVEMSPEDFFCHGTLKSEIFARLYDRVKRNNLGHLVTDRTRVSCPDADLSVEPDIVFVSSLYRRRRWTPVGFAWCPSAVAPRAAMLRWKVRQT